ncbi:DMT family transporter [Spirillospora sp. NBC_00431]
MPRSLRTRYTTDLALAALAPTSWGTTYVVTTTLLPAGRPLLAATLRALPAGLILLAVTRRLPRGEWWWKSIVLGMLNFGAFFPLIFFAAYRLPATSVSLLGLTNPMVATMAGLLILGQTLTPWQLAGFTIALGALVAGQTFNRTR